MNESIKQLTPIVGFTLIEVLMVMMIVSILTLIAYPSYISGVYKSNRADAMGTLTQDQIILERCYAQSFAYNAVCTALPTFPQASTQGYYNITLSNLSTSSYTLTATATGTQSDDLQCSTMSIDNTGQKTAQDNLGASQTACWNP